MADREPIASIRFDGPSDVLTVAFVPDATGSSSRASGSHRGQPASGARRREGRRANGACAAGPRPRRCAAASRRASTAATSSRSTSAGGCIRALGDPERVVNLRSAVKPFASSALLEAGGQREFGLEPAEIAIMAGSHSGEDLHVRTLQALFRRTGHQPGMLATRHRGHADRRAHRGATRPGRRAPGRDPAQVLGPARVVPAAVAAPGWSPDGYWLDDHPTQVATGKWSRGRSARRRPARRRRSMAAASRRSPSRSARSPGPTPSSRIPRPFPPDDPRAGLRRPLTDRPRRDARQPRDGRRDARSAGHLGDEGPAGPDRRQGRRRGAAAAARSCRARGARAAPRGVRARAQDRGRRGYDRATSAASVEALVQAGVLDGQPLRALARYHRPPSPDPHGRVAAEAIASFELAPVGELLRDPDLRQSGRRDQAPSTPCSPNGLLALNCSVTLSLPTWLLVELDGADIHALRQVRGPLRGRAPDRVVAVLPRRRVRGTERCRYAPGAGRTCLRTRHG